MSNLKTWEDVEKQSLVDPYIRHVLKMSEVLGKSYEEIAPTLIIALSDDRINLHQQLVDKLVNEQPITRASHCESCGTELKSFNPRDTSTWRIDNFCSAHCKRNYRLHNHGVKE